MGNFASIFTKKSIFLASDFEMKRSEEEEEEQKNLRCSSANKSKKRNVDDSLHHANTPNSRLDGRHCLKKARKTKQNESSKEEGNEKAIIKQDTELPKKERHLKCFLKLFGKKTV